MTKAEERQGFAQIALYYDSYDVQKRLFREECEHMMNTVNSSPIEAVCSTFYYYYCEAIEENGMERLAVILLGLLFEMEHDCIDPNLACAAAQHIEDFENGDYKDLFSESSYEQLTADITKVKTYLKEYFKLHPEALEG